MVYRSTTAATALESLEPRQLLAAGDLDLSFGQRGVAVLSQFGAAEQVHLRPDGEFLVGTATHVLRLNPNGSLDSSFDDDGALLTGLELAHTAFMPDGRIVAAGRRTIPGTPTRIEHHIARFNADGTPDTTFNGNGHAILPAPIASFITIAVQGDGKILIATEGSRQPEPLAPDAPAFLVGRFDADGTLDEGFGDNGLAYGDLGTVFGARAPVDIVVLPDGRIQLFGSDSPKGGGSTAFSDGFDADGDHIGAPFWRNRESFFLGAVLRGDGKVVPFGSIDYTSHDYLPGEPYAFAQFDGRDEALDFSPFSGDAGWPTDAVPVPGSPTQLYIAGIEARAMGVMRLNADGSPDESFGHGGTASVRPKKSWQRFAGHALAVAPDGDVILAGKITRKRGDPVFAIARFQGGAEEPTETPPAAGMVPFYPGERGGTFRPNPGDPRFQLSIQYAADDQIDTSSLGDADVIVLGPGRYRQRARFEDFSDVFAGTHRHVTANYSIPAPGGAWSAADNGRYRVLVRRRNVFDNHGQAVAAGQVGAFRVNIEANSASASVSRAFATHPLIPNKQDEPVFGSAARRQESLFHC